MYPLVYPRPLATQQNARPIRSHGSVWELFQGGPNLPTLLLYPNTSVQVPGPRLPLLCFGRSHHRPRVIVALRCPSALNRVATNQTNKHVPHFDGMAGRLSGAVSHACIRR